MARSQTELGCPQPGINAAGKITKIAGRPQIYIEKLQRPYRRASSYQSQIPERFRVGTLGYKGIIPGPLMVAVAGFWSRNKLEASTNLERRL